MKAISIREPWASAIADGRKTIEIRSWRTYHTGPMLICSTAPNSTALCITTIDYINRMRPEHEAASFCPCHPGAVAWHLTRVLKVKPFKVAGRQGLFDIPDELVNPIIPPDAMFDAWTPQISRWLQARILDRKKRAR
jgi:hypothetical protein